VHDPHLRPDRLAVEHAIDLARIVQSVCDTAAGGGPVASARTGRGS